MTGTIEDKAEIIERALALGLRYPEVHMPKISHRQDFDIMSKDS